MIVYPEFLLCVITQSFSLTRSSRNFWRCPFQLPWINKHQQTLSPHCCFQITLNFLNTTSPNADPWRTLPVTSLHGISWLF